MAWITIIGVVVLIILSIIWLLTIPDIIFKHFGIHHKNKKTLKKGKEVFSKMICPFCQKKLPDIEVYEGTTNICVCGAEYWADTKEDYWDTFHEKYCEGLPIMDIPKNTSLKLIRNYDQLGDDQNDNITDEVVIVFVSH